LAAVLSVDECRPQNVMAGDDCAKRSLQRVDIELAF
jgi:hypothetical protein